MKSANCFKFFRNSFFLLIILLSVTKCQLESERNLSQCSTPIICDYGFHEYDCLYCTTNHWRCQVYNYSTKSCSKCYDEANYKVKKDSVQGDHCTEKANYTAYIYIAVIFT